MDKLKITSFILLALLVFFPFQSAAASGANFDGQVIFGQSYTLKSGNTLNGDLLVFGGSATIEQGATVTGNVVLFGGTLLVNGDVDGDVAVTGGSVTIGSPAHLHGNLTTVGASLDRADGSQIDGKVFNTATSWVGNGSNANPITPLVVTPPAPAVSFFNLIMAPFKGVANAVGQSLGIALLAMLVMLFLAPHADRVAHAVLNQPLVSGGLGLLTVIVFPIALVLLIITFILIPVAVVAVLALVVAGLFGWIAIGYEIGQRFTRAIHQEWHPSFSAGLGVFVLTLLASALLGIPVLNCVGWLAPVLLTLAGLGAVIMSRFGTQLVLAPSAAASAAVVPAAPPVQQPPVSGSEPQAPSRKPRAKKEE
jgi:cytoskeletal protein CcmA (bactofilin family)